MSAKTRTSFVGLKFNRLTVTSEAPRTHIRHHRWNCICECGNTAVAEGRHLVSGRTQSCGCWRREQSIKRAASGGPVVTKTHGQSDSDIYAIWCNIKKRCDPSRGTKNYAARGIQMCARWSESFEAFYSDMGSRPTPSHSVERIDNNGNYEPGNCRWAVPLEQGANKRNNRLITHNGETKHLAEWARSSGLKISTLWERLRLGWDFQDAITRPLRITKAR